MPRTAYTYPYKCHYNRTINVQGFLWYKNLETEPKCNFSPILFPFYLSQHKLYFRVLFPHGEQLPRLPVAEVFSGSVRGASALQTVPLVLSSLCGTVL